MKLHDIYTDGQIEDVHSEIYQHIAEEDLEADFTVFDIAADRVRSLMATPFETILETWEHAEDWQEELVEQKRIHVEQDRAIMLRGDLVIDGHHHVMAAILDGRPVRAIDLDEFDLTPPGP